MSELVNKMPSIEEMVQPHVETPIKRVYIEDSFKEPIEVGRTVVVRKGFLFSRGDRTEHKETLSTITVTVVTEDGQAMRFNVEPHEYARKETHESSGFGYYRKTDTRTRDIPSLLQIIVDRINGDYKEKSPELVDYLRDKTDPTHTTKEGENG